MFVVENDRICRESAVSVGEGGRVSAKAMRRPVPAAVIQRRTRQSLVSTMPAQCFIRPSIQRSPQYTVHAAQAHSALTWFSPPVETVARGVAAEQSPATWSHRLVIIRFSRYKKNRCLLDAMADLPGEPRPTCIDLPPPQFCFPSGYLAHQLAAHFSRLSPALRIKEAVDYWIPCLLGQRLTGSVGPETGCAIPEPTPDFVSEVTEAYKVLVRTVDDMLVTAPPLREPAIPAEPAEPETIHRHQKAPNSPPRQRWRVAHHRAVAAPSHPSPAEVEALVTKAMREAGLTTD
nr:unnamed protein product [Spirometra erinaceieuropaei]